MNETELRRFDLNLLVTLHVLLEERSVSRAALRLNISQSAVSHALTRLRESFGDPLLVRTSQGMTPTAKAETLRERIAYILHETGSLLAKSSFDASQASGVFRITATDYGAMIVFPQLMKYLSEAAPHITLECLQWNDQTLTQLESGVIDLALGGQKPFDGFECEPLFEDQLVVAAGLKHPLAAKRKLTAKEFTAYPHAVITITSSRMPVIDEILSKKGLSRKVSLRIPYFLVAPRIIENTELLLVMPEVGARQMLGHLSLKLFLPPFDLATYSYIQVWHKKREDDALHRWMRESIKTICTKFISLR